MSHRCLFVSEILRLIFQCVRLWDEDSRRVEDDASDEDAQHNDGKKTLASLARTCRSFSAVALDILWRVLDSLDPLLAICPKPETSTDETDWSSFHKYAERVRCIQICGRNTRVSASVRQALITSLNRFPGDRCLIFPKLIWFHWREIEFLSPDDSGIPLLHYFIGPTVTNLALSIVRFHVPSESEWTILSDLPKRCPNVTSFTCFFSCPHIYDPSLQVGEMVCQWKKLQSLRSCAIPKSNMDKLASQRTLDTLGIEINMSSPTDVDHIPDTARELLLSPRDASLCTRYLEHVHARPTICRLSIGMNYVDDTALEELFHLIPLRFDTHRLEYLDIQPVSALARWPLSDLPKLRLSLLQPLTQFAQLHTLDMDRFCPSELDDGDYAQLASSWTHLRHLKMGTANVTLGSVIERMARPAASVVAVVVLVTRCLCLETLSIAFDGTITPPTFSLGKPGDTESVREDWGAPNKRMTSIHVGYSPVAEENVRALASSLKSLMPSLKEIKHHGVDKKWGTVQDTLTTL